MVAAELRSQEKKSVILKGRQEPRNIVELLLFHVSISIEFTTVYGDITKKWHKSTHLEQLALYYRLEVV
jgi:hypothetical protein